MEGLKKPETGSCFVNGFVNKKRRGVRERTSCESGTPFAKKKAKMDSDYKEASMGVPPSSSSDLFSGKPPVGVLTASGKRTGEDERKTTVKCASHGLISVIGRRRVMEDTVAVAVVGKLESFDFFAVYDGHGGSYSSEMCRDRLHLIISDEVEERRKRRRMTSRRDGVSCDGEGGGGGGEGGLEYWGEVMAASFAKMDEEVNNIEEREYPEAVESEGSTAVVVMVGEEELVVANCGGSRAVMYRGGMALPLSRDHKPDSLDEKERVEAAGGRVINGHVLGVLATSRSIGDRSLKPYVISKPEVTVSERRETDEFIVIGSDGLWDIVSNELACEVVRRCLNGELENMKFPENTSTGNRAAEAASLLAEMAIARGGRDNISVVVVELKMYSRGGSSSSK
ncbi:hypothetical protein LWI28_023939 [Acer negundo]|uniref:protein-serine/threonine phosphatase n=1 Tax=Acer negundo TaxID=4023 RepID=A0AAD5IR89_ACENE|nr:hypothetical protein LWI28_023939 [Acer negundo]KAK4843450.1 hypothetical protein QYF36_008136 [Acer negundo]